MTQHDDSESVQHMLAHAREAMHMAAGRSRNDLDTDRTFELALTRLVEIVGEASTRISETYKNKHPEVPWPLLRGMRNRLIHGYDQVDKQVLWNTITDDLPPLIAQLEAIVEK